MSYVLTASPKFLDTLDNIVKGLNRAGFSDNDYKIAEPEKPQEPQTVVPSFEQGDLFAPQKPESETATESDDLDSSKITFLVSDNQRNANAENQERNQDTAEETLNKDVDEIVKKVEAEAEKEASSKNLNNKPLIPTELENQVKTYKMKDVFKESAKSLKIPQFLSDDTSQELTNELFVELHQQKLFESEELLRNFKLGNEDSNIDFDSVESSMYRVDIDENNKYAPTYLKVEGSVHERIVEYILDPSKKGKRIENCTYRLKNIIGKMYPIPDKEIELFISHVLERFTDEQFSDLLNHEYSYADKIKQKIKELSNNYKEKQFLNMVDKDLIFTEEAYLLPAEIIPSKSISGLPKSLYEKEGEIDGFEREVINDVANLENVEFWTRNLERSKGFCINGFINHYPDFIIKTKKGKIVLLETKGDHLDAEKKIKLGNLWASKAGNNYKYCLVYKERKADGAYTKSEFIDLIKAW